MGTFAPSFVCFSISGWSVLSFRLSVSPVLNSVFIDIAVFGCFEVSCAGVLKLSYLLSKDPFLHSFDVQE